MAETTSGDKRLKQLEEEIRRLREPLEKTLLDIREMINNAENPFNFFTKSMNDAQFVPEKTNSAPDEKTFDDSPVVESEKPKVLVSSDKPVASKGLDSFISILAAVDLMVLMVGRDYLINLANMLAWKNLIPKALLDGIKEALEFLSSFDKGKTVEQIPAGQPTFNDLLIVLYMFSLLVKDRENPLTFLLLTSTGNLKFLKSSWGGRQ